LRTELGDCTRCFLHEKRQNLVFGEGNQRPRLMVIGDWPGPEDDRTGLPFQGIEGEMLTNMLKAIGLERPEVYVTTLVKCQPPAGRPPTRDEIATCLPFLFQQIDAIAPVVICAMGPLATQTLLVTDQPLTRLRGGFHDCRGVALMPTFHPRFLHKNPEMKKATWQDLLMVKKKLAL
jgi:DNA polymerase